MIAGEFVLIQIPKTLLIKVVASTSLTLKVDGLTEISGGTSGGSGTRYIYNFSNAELDAQGFLIVQHNLNLAVVDVSVFSPDYGEVEPQSVRAIDSNTVAIALSSFQPLNGSWKVLIEA